MIPERSARANSAKSIFFEEVNDIDIYIEDTAHGYAKLFTKIFNRIFDGKYRISKVFPLGGRMAVIDEHSKDGGKRPSLYIIDGDLWLLHGDTIASQKGLYKLPTYCIENILCDPQAISSILDEEDAEKDQEQIINEMKYGEWLSLNEELLFLLFIEYAVSMKINPTEKTVSLKVSDLVSGKIGEVDPIKINNRINAIKSKTIDASDNEVYDSTRLKIISDFEQSGLAKLDIVSGKDYLFPLLKTRAKSIVKTKLSDLNFKMRLAKICDINKIINSIDFVAND